MDPSATLSAFPFRKPQPATFGPSTPGALNLPAGYTAGAVQDTPASQGVDMTYGFAKVAKRWQLAFRASPFVARDQPSVEKTRRQLPTSLLRDAREVRSKALCAMPEFLEQFRVHLDQRAVELEGAIGSLK
jgi:hypothetical protein